MKTETQKKEIMKTEVEQAVLKYLQNAENHIFVHKNAYWDKENEFKENEFIKVIKAIINDKIHVIKILVMEDKVSVIDIRDVSNIVTKNQLGMMKNFIFHQWMTYKAISYNGDEKRNMNLVIDDIKEYFNDNSDKTLSELKIDINSKKYSIK